MSKHIAITTSEARSKIMRSVLSHGNSSTEQKLVSILQKHKVTGWRRKYPLLGHPDFVFRQFKVAIFTDGCFWHGHNCRNLVPKSNFEYWENKIKLNKKRDRSVNYNLRKRGWKVIRIWECQIDQEEKTVRKINKAIMDRKSQ